MNSIATSEYVTLKLCLTEIPIEIVEIIVNFLVIPIPPRVVKLKNLCICGENDNFLDCATFQIESISLTNGWSIVKMASFMFREVNTILCKKNKLGLLDTYDLNKADLMLEVFYYHIVHCDTFYLSDYFCESFRQDLLHFLQRNAVNTDTNKLEITQRLLDLLYEFCIAE